MIFVHVLQPSADATRADWLQYNKVLIFCAHVATISRADWLQYTKVRMPWVFKFEDANLARELNALKALLSTDKNMWTMRLKESFKHDLAKLDTNVDDH